MAASTQFPAGRAPGSISATSSPEPCRHVRIADEGNEWLRLPREDCSAHQPALALIRPKDAQPVEDRHRIQECPHNRARAQLRPAEAVLEPDRQLTDTVVPERRGDGDQLEVEGEALDEQQREHVLHDGTVEDLQPDLRVANVEAEEQAIERLVAPARNSTRERVMDDRSRMTLRADREIQALPPCSLDVRRDIRRIDVEVGVDQRDPFAMRRERAGPDRVALAEVAVVVDDADARLGPGGEQPLGSVVDRTVRHDDQLELCARQPLNSSRANHVDVLDDVVAAVVDGHDNRQKRSSRRTGGRGREAGGQRVCGSHRDDSRPHCYVRRPVDFARYSRTHRHFRSKRLPPFLARVARPGVIADIGAGDGAVLYALSRQGRLGPKSYAIERIP
jgi:hypothetical protein